MKCEDIVMTLGEIGDELIEAADRKPPVRRFNKKLLLAAALISLAAVVAAVGIWRMSIKRTPPVTPVDVAETEKTVDTDDPTTESDTETTDSSQSEPPENGGQTTGSNKAVTPKEPENNGKKQTQPPVTAGRQSTSPPDNAAAPEITTGPADTSRPAETKAPADTTAPDAPQTPDVTEKSDVPPEEELMFADVDMNNWAYKAIEYVTKHGYMVCRSKDHFEPDRDLTRAEFAYAMYAIAGSPEVTGYYTNHKCCADTELDEWYYNAVLWSRLNMIVNGNMYNGPGDMFYPDKPITRSDIAVAMLRLFNYLGLELTDTAAVPEFDDIETVPENARNSVRSLAGAGVMTGRDGNMFDPYAGTTRAESAAMIKSLMDHSKKRPVGLLEKYGLTLTYGAQKWQDIPSDESQKIVVSLKTQNGKELPDLKVEGDVTGNECRVYGVNFTNTYTGAYSDKNSGELAQFIYCVPRSHEYQSAESGWFFDDEILTVKLKISVGEESTDMTLYLKVVNYS